MATAARFGTFQIDASDESSRERASNLANQIRFLKSIDPTLGLYAAYAYAGAGMQDEVNSVYAYMKSDLKALMFDVAMLTYGLSTSGNPDLNRKNVAPFCPMLSQGWNYLNSRDANLRPEVVVMRRYLRQSLWTTFDATGIYLLINSVKSGRL